MWGPVLKQDYAQLYSMEQCREAEGQDWITDRMLCAGTGLEKYHLSSMRHYTRLSTDWS